MDFIVNLMMDNYAKKIINIYVIKMIYQIVQHLMESIHP